MEKEQFEKILQQLVYIKYLLCDILTTQKIRTRAQILEDLEEVHD